MKKIFLRYVIFVIIFLSIIISCGDNEEKKNETPSNAIVFASKPINGEIPISWKGIDGASFYNIYWNTTGNVTISDNVISKITETSYVHKGLFNNTIYYYMVTGVIMFKPVNGENTISWKKVESASYYNIYWNTTGNIKTSDNCIENITGTSYIHRGLASNQTYYYLVMTVNEKPVEEILNFVANYGNEEVIQTNHRPLVSITMPDDNSNFTQGESINFVGNANDKEDGVLTGSSLVWTSSIDGQIGTGTSFQINIPTILTATSTIGTLSTIGTHTITLTATDNDGLSDTDSIQIKIIAKKDNSPPSVSIVSPSIGNSFVEGTTINFIGSATDVEDGILSGNSLIWTSSIDGQIGIGTSFDTNNLSVGTHIIKLIATDKDGEQQNFLIQITITSQTNTNNNFPSVTISSPMDNSIFNQGEDINFVGNANDKEDGILTGNSLVWTSSIDGQITTGASFKNGNLSVGTHVITLTATDKDGNSSTQSINIIVQVIGIPSVSITMPSNNSSFTQGEDINFVGNANDKEDGILTGNSLVWTSSIDGQIGTGVQFGIGIQFSINKLSVGTHVITLTATDSNGFNSSASVRITILAQNTAPIATINRPLNGANYTVGDNINFIGSGNDKEDGILTGNSLVWTLSINGQNVQIGTGTSFTNGNLSVGTHTITLTATDSDGLSNTASINISISQSATGAITNSIGMTFVLIPAGTFIMGSPSYELGRNTDENQHKVTLSKAFYMQTTEVTQGQWKAIMGSNPSNFINCGDDCPVENVNWNDCQQFIDRLNRTEAVNIYRLPTEAEWEYSCRAGSTTALANGSISVTNCDYDSNLDMMGWYCNNSNSASHLIKQKQANAWGLHDMHGNVREWCSDWYGSYSPDALTDPTGPNSGSYRVIRGGAWAILAQYCRSAARSGDTPSVNYGIVGFRLVRQVP
ncbi:MAG: SUMF1/EgtB/PvdO family nonheme iron enzyme [Desulfobacterales bacterium]|nr:SUMF1/EgtB/PvdO family nonheme iron enzyme [Desulfobacterales bacterium]